MPPMASRIRLIPPEVWDEARLADAARRMPEKAGPLTPGDSLAGFVVVGVEPALGSAANDATVIEILPTPRATSAGQVDLAVLIDVGESMDLAWSAELKRAEAARESLAGFLGKSATGVADVIVYAYGKEARIVAGPLPHAQMKAFDVPRAGGRARTGHAIDTALAHLAARARPDRVQAILLLADSVGGEDEFHEAVARAANLRIPIHTVVYAPATDALFEEAARLTNGSVQRASLPLVIEFTHEA